MKTRIFISILCFSLSACASQKTVSVQKSALLDFADLANEITVNHEVDTSTATLVDASDGNSTD